MFGAVSWLVFSTLLLGADGPQHWAFRPVRRPTIPQVASGWARTPIDAFLRQQLTKAGLEPAGEADRTTLIRRLSFDLTGLPPTPEEVAAFVADASPDAYERLVDRLLASPRYGEKWGRHWLDVVRYAESEGFEYDRMRPGAWRYRDYVVRAFNDDRPFGQFILEQIAGDELDPNNHECLVAAGFHRLGPVRRNAGNKLIAMSRNEVLTEMTDAVGSAFLGLTVGCARCHDHRFDDIPAKDYYRLQAFLAATQEHDVVLADAKTQAEWKATTDKLLAQIKKLTKERAPRAEIVELKRSLPPPLPTIPTVRDEERTVIHVLKRGDPERKGPVVGPRALGLFVGPGAPELDPAIASPRLQLARWLADAEHPLTARVWVNRVWQYHFGRGLVATPNDFGHNGTPPSHPELLDYLASVFVQGGMHTKPLHRLIVTSAAYRQASVGRDDKSGQRLDPENRLLWHFPRRRLSAEEVRDTMLAVAGTLLEKSGGPSVMLPVAQDLVDQLYDATQWQVTPDEREHHCRSIYLIAKRNLQLPFFQVFDQPSTQTSCPRREMSTHPLQALELLNGEMANRLAASFAERLERECGANRRAYIDRAFRLTAGRPPTPREAQLAAAFLDRQPATEFALALFNLNAFLYVD